MIAEYKFYLALGRKMVSPALQRCQYPETFIEAEVDTKSIEYFPCLFDSAEKLAKAKAQLQQAKKHCYKIMDCALEGLPALRCCWFLLWQILGAGR